jgi:arginine exporter protein ArgO
VDLDKKIIALTLIGASVVGGIVCMRYLPIVLKVIDMGCIVVLCLYGYQILKTKRR